MASEPAEDLVFRIEGPDGGAEELVLPTALVDALGQGGTPVETVADIATIEFASQAHHLVHHGGEGADARVEAAEERMLELFEDRFGVSFGEATGHSH